MEELKIEEIEEVKNPIKLFNTSDMIDSLISKIESKAKTLVSDLDVSTAKSRKTIAGVAAKVARSKTYLDGLGKNLVTDLKKQTGAIDAQRRQLRSRLDALKKEVRQPLTKWEQAEKNRIADIHSRIDVFLEVFTGSVEQIKARIAEIEAITIDDSFAEFADKAAIAKDAGLLRIRSALEKAEVEEKAKKEAEEKDKRIQTDAAKETENKQVCPEYSDEKISENHQGNVNNQNNPFTTISTKTVNREHQIEVNRAVLNALVEKSGLSEQQSKAVIVLVIKGQIPYMTINY